MICWCHLSDLHFKREEVYNQNVVLKALWKDLIQFRDNGFEFDFIVFTGDIAFRGIAEEYQAARDEFFVDLLKTTGIDKSRLLLIPGNHDCRRDIVNKLVNPLTGISDSNKLTKFFQEKVNVKIYGEPQDDFFNFVEATTGERSPSRFWTQKDIPKDDKIISLIGLNSAWLSNYHQEVDGKVCDDRKLAMGEINLAEALDAGRGSDVTIAAFHHPLDWMMEFDRRRIESLLAEHCDIALHGHLHEANVSVTTSTRGRLITIPAGAVFLKREWPNAYNIVRLDMETMKGWVHLRRYSEKAGEWVKDLDSTGEKAGGSWPISLADGADTSIRRPFRLRKLYSIHFSNECLDDLMKLGIDQMALISLVEREFRSHKTHYDYDLEDIAFPVKDGYVVFLDKIEKNLTFNRVRHGSDNREKMAQWEDYLADYRMSTILAYRQEPERLLTSPAMLSGAKELHTTIRHKIISFFESFERLIVDPSKRQAVLKYIENEPSDSQLDPNPFPPSDDFLNMVSLVKAETSEKKLLAETIAGHIGSSQDSLSHATKICIHSGGMNSIYKSLI